MTRKTGAIAALKKLEAEREKLNQRQRELEAKAATELGRALLGTGVEGFGAKHLKQIGMALGKRGEEKAVFMDGPVKPGHDGVRRDGPSSPERKRPRRKTGEA